MHKELNIIEVFTITGKKGLCYITKIFDGWETLQSFHATGKASGNFTILERDKVRSAFSFDVNKSVGFIAVPYAKVYDLVSDDKLDPVVEKVLEDKKETILLGATNSTFKPNDNLCGGANAMYKPTTIIKLEPKNA